MNALIALLFLIQSGVIVALLVFFHRSQKQWMKFSLSENVHEFESPMKVEEENEVEVDQALDDISEDEFSKIIRNQINKEE